MLKAVSKDLEVSVSAMVLASLQVQACRRNGSPTNHLMQHGLACKERCCKRRGHPRHKLSFTASDIQRQKLAAAP